MRAQPKTNNRTNKKRTPMPAATPKPRLSVVAPVLPGSAKKPKSSLRRTPVQVPDWWAAALVTLTVIFFGLVRIRLLSFPLERDEGEYGYAGQLLLHGINPYRLCYSMKLPGTAAAYALFTAVFGQTVAGVHVGLLLVNSVTTVLMYFVGRKVFGRLAGVVAAAAYSFLSLEPTVLGFAAHATQFVALAAVAGVLLLLKAEDTSKSKLFFWSGLTLGAGFLMKQPGLFFILFAALYLLFSEWMRGFNRRRSLPRIALFLLGSALPFAGACLWMASSGLFARFWFWTFSYASQYGNIVGLGQGLQIFWGAVSQVVAPAMLLWILAGIGVIAVFWDQKARIHSVFLLGFLTFSFAAICPGLYFRQHYFVLLLPAVALLCGVAVGQSSALVREFISGESSTKMWLTIIPALVFLAALGISVYHDREFFFVSDPVAACHRLYGHNPFPEAPQIADFIRRRAGAGDQIAVIGSEPEIYFYSRLRSATGYVYTYPLMEPQPFAVSMQEEMETEIERAMPRFVIFADVSTSWLSGPESNLGILGWAEKFVKTHYQLVGVVDLLDEGTVYRWDSDARTYQGHSDTRVLVFQKI
jgi:hypothetical protein